MQHEGSQESAWLTRIMPSQLVLMIRDVTMLDDLNLRCGVGSWEESEDVRDGMVPG